VKFEMLFAAEGDFPLLADDHYRQITIRIDTGHTGKKVSL
jgi:hypothetical protein